MQNWTNLIRFRANFSKVALVPEHNGFFGCERVPFDDFIELVIHSVHDALLVNLLKLIGLLEVCECLSKLPARILQAYVGRIASHIDLPQELAVIIIDLPLVFDRIAQLFEDFFALFFWRGRRSPHQSTHRMRMDIRENAGPVYVLHYTAHHDFCQDHVPGLH